MEGKELALAVCKALSDKKAHDIVTVNVADQTVMCSYFVIASGTSTTQVRALGDYVEEELEKQGLTAVRKEGLREGARRRSSACPRAVRRLRARSICAWRNRREYPA